MSTPSTPVPLNDKISIPVIKILPDRMLGEISCSWQEVSPGLHLLPPWEGSGWLVWPLVRSCCDLSCVMENCALRSLSLSYPKKDWQAGPSQSFFGYDTDYKFVLFCIQRNVRPHPGNVINLTRIVGAPPANPSFGIITTKILRHVFSWHGSFCSRLKDFGCQIHISQWRWKLWHFTLWLFWEVLVINWMALETAYSSYPWFDY